MADAFLTSDLQLDVRAALQQVDRLNEAVHRATTNIRVTADVRQVTAGIDAAVDAADSLLTIAADTSRVPGEITAAVDAADSAIVVTGEATDVTGSIDSAVENANTSVEVTGQAAQVTGAIDAAVENANTTVSVEGQVSPGLRQGVDSLGDGLDAAATSGISLKKILAGLSVTAAVAGIRKLADAGSDLAESTSKASVVFGDEFADIEAFAGGAAKSVGLTEQAAFEATGTFGNLFQALGTSREEAARLSPEVVSLAADLASFNNLGVDETLEKLRSGLVGEIEPLRSLGVSFLAADVTAKGLELGLGGVTGELTEGEKVQARYALITEQTALAQGDFARTSEGFANQQRILSAEMGNAAAAAGTLLLPAVLAIVAAARDAIPGLSELGEDVLPAVSDALVNLAPLIGTTVDLLILLSPLITVVAEALAAIPPGVISAGAGILLANKAFSLLGGTLGGLGPALKSVPGIIKGVSSAVPAATSGVGALGGGVQKLAGAVAGLNPLVVGAAVGAGLLAKEWMEGRDRAADVDRAVDAMSESFAGVGTDVTSARGAIKGFLTDMVEAGDKIQSTNRFLDEMFTAHEVFDGLGLSASSAADLIAGGVPAVQRFNAALAESGQETGLAGKALEELARQAGDGAKANLLARQETDGLTDAQERQLTILTTSGGTTQEYVDLLDEVSVSSLAAAAETERLTAKYAPLIAGLVGTGDALSTLADSAPTVATAISDLGASGDVSDATFLNLATTLKAAALTEEEMGLAAAGLGISVESLQVFIENTTGALSEFVDTAVAGLPTISQAFRDANDDSKVSAREFIDALAEDTVSLTTFIADLNTIISEGFTEVAAGLATQGVEVAGTAAAELAGAARTGNTALLTEWQIGIDERDAATAGATAFLRDVLGPEFVTEAGVVGLHGTAAFGENFDPQEKARVALALAKSGLTVDGQEIAAIAATVGSEEARRYGESLNLDERTITEAVRAGAAIKANAPVGAASTAGVAVGEAFANGVFEGISNRAGAASDKAAQLVVQAKNAADRAARSGSPSLLFAELGEDIADGLALGMGDAAGVVAAAESLVRAAAAGVAGVQVDPIGLAASASSAAAAGASGVSVTLAAGAIVVQAPLGMTREQGVEVGEGIADGLERRLVERRLSVLSRAT